MGLTRAFRASVRERARWSVRQYQTLRLSEELGLPPIHARRFETLQTVATIKASLKEHVRTVVDVGAHVGEFAEPATRALGADETVCIEPHTALHHQLESRLAGLKYRILGCALGDAPGVGVLKVHTDPSMNSLLDADPCVLAEEFNRYDNRVSGATTVPISTLDEELTKLNPPGPFLVKLDTQGTELQILQGAGGVLQHTAAVLVEHMFTTPYKGVPAFVELITFMDSVGLECVAVTEVTRRPTHRVSGVDFLFCPRV